MEKRNGWRGRIYQLTDFKHRTAVCYRQLHSRPHQPILMSSGFEGCQGVGGRSFSNIFKYGEMRSNTDVFVVTFCGNFWC